jgi:hypothetical protein
MSENSNVLSSPDQLIDRVITDIKTQFPTVSVSDYEPLSREPIETPAILLEVVEIGKSARASGGRKAYSIELIAHCVLGSQTPNVGREICNMALFLLGLVDGNAWGLGRAVEAAGEAKAFPGVPIVGSDGCERWIVQWTQKNTYRRRLENA